MSRRPWLDRLLDRALPKGPSGDAIRGDLSQERSRRVDIEGERAAGRWYARQAVSIWLFATRDRFLGRRWRSGRAIAGHGTLGGGFAGDMRDGIRALRRSPGYSAAVTLTLGVAMAATVSVFTVVRGILLRDLPFPEPDQLIRIDALHEGGPRNGGLSYPTFRDWHDEIGGIQAFAAFQGEDGVYVGEGIAEVWTGAGTSRGFLSTLGVQPLLGTFYAPPEGDVGENTIYLGQGLWERRFASDPGIVGRTIEFDTQSWLVRGVMPRDFHFPTSDTQFWIPLRDRSFLSQRGAGLLRVIGRLSPDVSHGAAAQELDAVTAALNVEHDTPGKRVLLRRIDEVERASVERVLWTFLGAVGFFLLVACANVSGLALARTESRRQEFSVRLSLGASRAQLVRQQLVESTVLASLGGIAGLLGAVAGVRGLLALAPADLPMRDAISIDPLVTVLACLVAVSAGILFGVLPAVRGSQIAGARPDGSRSIGRASRRTHHALAGAQVALAVVLLSGAGLLLRSFAALNAVETGFTAADRLLIVEMNLNRADYQTAEQILEFHRRFLEGLAQISTVQSAGLSSHLPFTGARITASVVTEGEAYRRDRTRQMGLEFTNGEYRSTLGLPLLRGRDPERDPGGEVNVREVLINEAGANLLWPGEDPVGHRFSFDVDEGQIPGEDSYYRVSGLVPDVMDVGLDQEVGPRAYYDLPESSRQYSFISGRFFYTIIRTSGDPYVIMDRVRQLAYELDPTAPIRNASSLEQLIRDTTVPARFRTVTLTIFAALAVIVALLGIYGVMAYGVATSVRDIGVRMALGAEARSVRTQVMRQALLIVTVGGVSGVLASGLLGPVLGSMLFQVPERDPVTLAGVLGLSVLGSLAAAYLPALRASRVDPIRVLRQD